MKLKSVRRSVAEVGPLIDVISLLFLKNLRSISIFDISAKDFSLVAAGCPKLKDIYANVVIWGNNDAEEMQDFLVGASCSPVEISINLLVEEGFKMLAGSFPHLEILTIRIDAGYFDDPVRPDRFQPLGDLGLRKLIVDWSESKGEWLNRHLESLLLHIFVSSSENQRKISTSLEILKLVGGFEEEDGEEEEIKITFSAPFTSEYLPNLKSLAIPILPDTNKAFDLPRLTDLRIYDTNDMLAIEVASFLSKAFLSSPVLARVAIGNFLPGLWEYEEEVDTFFRCVKTMDRPWEFLLERSCDYRSSCADYLQNLQTKAESFGLRLRVSYCDFDDYEFADCRRGCYCRQDKDTQTDKILSIDD